MFKSPVHYPCTYNIEGMEERIVVEYLIESFSDPKGNKSADNFLLRLVGRQTDRLQ